MERSRSKRGYYYDQDYESPGLSSGRIKPRYHHHHHNRNNHHRQSLNRNFGGASRLQKLPSSQHLQESTPDSTCFRILCPDIKAGSVIGKSGSIIKAFRQETGAWINVHPLLPGDEERIIEISDVRRRDPDGHAVSFSPAQEALLMIHERILEFDNVEVGGFDEEDEYALARVATRLVVPRNHVGCLLGKGGKIIEQMRQETKTQIRILPRDQHLPRCVSISEEIVQIVGDATSVKKAVEIISSRLKENPTRERAPYYGRINSPERYFLLDEDFPHMNNMLRRPSLEPRSAGLTSVRSASYASWPSGYAFDSIAAPLADHPRSSGDELVFRILCPKDKVDSIMGEPGGIIELLRGDIGVNVRVTDPLPGSDEQIVIVASEEIYASLHTLVPFSGHGPHCLPGNGCRWKVLRETFPKSPIFRRILEAVVRKWRYNMQKKISLKMSHFETVFLCIFHAPFPVMAFKVRRRMGAVGKVLPFSEGPDENLFPAQEALLHIQSHIVDLGPDKDNIITTRLLVPSSEIGCLDGRDGSLSEMRRLTRANIQILPREELPSCALGADELVQIVGDIRAAREALVLVTSRLRGYLYRENSFPRDLLPPQIAAPGNCGSMFGLEDGSPNRNSTNEVYQGSGPLIPGYQSVQTSTTPWLSKDVGGCGNGPPEYEETSAYEEVPSGSERFCAPLITKRTLEVVIPEHAVPSLIMRSGNKLFQISEMSGASVSLVEDHPGLLERVVQISGSPEQAERAQSLLQGFVLSTQDVPSS